MELFAKSIGSQISRLAVQRVSVGQSIHLSRTCTTAAQPQQQQQQANSRTEVEYEELSDLLTFNRDLALIDVRNPQELDTYGSIPGAINIPLNEVKLALQLPENEFQDLFLLPKPSRKTKNLVFFARGPNASSAAVEIAHRLGFKGSRQYSGGWEDYCNKTGVPLKKNSQNSQEQSSPFIGQSSYNIYNTYSI